MSTQFSIFGVFPRELPKSSCPQKRREAGETDFYEAIKNCHTDEQG